MIILFCAFLVLKAKYIQFHSNFRAGKMSKMRELSVAERAKSVSGLKSKIHSVLLNFSAGKMGRMRELSVAERAIL